MLTKSKIALWLTLGVTLLVTVLRTVLTPLLQSMDTGSFALDYLTVGVVLAAFVAFAVLLRSGKTEMKALPAVKGPWTLPIAVLLMAVGLCLIVISVVDLYKWSALGITPPPSKELTGTADRITLFLSLGFGILSGVYFLRIGLLFLSENAEARGAFPLWALAPTFWIWMRLARYEVSYASAVELHESFFDFVMLLCAMLFLFALARQLSDVDAKQPWQTVWFGCMTVVMCMSGTLSRVGLFLLGQGDAYRAGQLAGFADFAVGLLATAYVLYWTLTPQPVAEEVAEDVPEEIEADLETETE